MESDEKFKRFLEWVRINDLYISPNISVHNFNCYGLGGFLDHEISQEQIPFTLIRIPLSAAINTQTALNSQFGKWFKKFMNEISNTDRSKVHDVNITNRHTNNDLFEENNILLYLFLVHERFVKGENSFWSPYLELLPTQFETSIFFTDEELSELKGTNLLKSTLSVREKLGNVFQTIIVPLTKKCPEWFPAESFTFERLIWAYSCVWSRVFPVKALLEDGVTEVVYPTLLPLIDILNHQFNSKITYKIDYVGQTFSLESQTPLSQGRQVFNNYGAKSNDSFLLSYGFVIPDNSEDTNYIQLGFNDTDSDLVQHKQRLISALGFRLGHYLRKDKLPEGLIPSLRICAMNVHEIYFNSISEAKSETFNSMVSFRNEQAVYQSLKRLLRQKINEILEGASLKQTMRKLREIISSSHDGKDRHQIRMFNISVYKLGQLEILANNLSMLENLERQYVTNLDLRKVIPSNLMYHGEFIYGMDEDIIIQTFNWVQSKNQSGKDIQFTKQDFGDLLPSINRSVGHGDFLVLSVNDTINISTVLSHPIGKAIQKLNNEELFDDETTVMIYILYNKFCPIVSQSSPFKHFFDSLPSTFNTTLFFPEHVLEQLEHTSLLEDTKELRQELQSTFQDIFNVCGQNKQFVEHFNVSVLCFENFLWSYTIYDTLIKDGMIIPIPGLYSPRFYDPNCQIDQYTGSGDKIHLRLIYADNSNVVPIRNNHLASMHNDELMLRYGAIFGEDVGDIFFPLTLDSVSLEPLLDHECKNLLLEYLHLGFDHVLGKCMGCKVRTPNRLLNMLRICFMKEDEAMYYHKQIVEEGQRDCPLVIQNETHVQNTVLSVLMSILQSFPMSIQDDEQMLRKLEHDIKTDVSMQPHVKRENLQKQMCIRYRMQLKQVVQLTLESIQQDDN